METAKSRRLRTNVVRLLILVVFFGAWQLLSGPVLPPTFFSSPTGVVNALWKFAIHGVPAESPIPLYDHVWITIYETVVGFALAAVIGIVTGVLLGLNRAISETVDPFIYVLYAIPKIALAPLFILWFGYYAPSKIFMSFVVAYFVVFYTTYGGVVNVSEELKNVLKVMGASRHQIILKIVLPAAYPFIFVGLRTALPLALVGAVVGEFLSSSAGLGFIINYSTQFFYTDGVFAGIAVLTVIALFMDYGFKVLQSRLIKWQPEMER